MTNLRTKGSQGEAVAARYFEGLGMQIIATNYTIADGEIDIIAESDVERIFVEVKMVSPETDLYGYITPRKISALQRTASTYNLKYPTDKYVRLDAVFVAENKILEHFEHISFYQ